MSRFPAKPTLYMILTLSSIDLNESGFSIIEFSKLTKKLLELKVQVSSLLSDCFPGNGRINVVQSLHHALK